MANSETFVEAPYPGLRYYRPEQEKFFAARGGHASACYEVLMKSRILILHGNTGCGKSSFLRAGLKPHIENARGSAMLTQEDEGELQVIRSGSDPLEMIAEQIRLNVERCLACFENDREIYGGEVDESITDVLADEHRTREAFAKAVRNDPSLLVEVIEGFEQALEHPPAIVIDQAEEVFTLNIREATSSDSKRNGVEERSAPTERELSDRQLEALTNPYFRFLANFAKSKLETRVIISLRTEYKGQFDDRLFKMMPAGMQAHGSVTGYHLPDLDRDGMREAILAPTEEAGADFQFDSEAVESIVDRLYREIPAGGRLPVLQIVCLRLWLRLVGGHEAPIRRRDSSAPIAIKLQDIRLLGPFENQIRDYLRERVREMIDEYREDDENGDYKDIGARTEKWLGFLKKFFVDVLADGRAVTKKPTASQIQRALTNELGEAFAAFSDPNAKPEECVLSGRSELDWLAQDRIGILRKERQSNRETRWMLGHDSIGLVLDRWWQIYGSSMQSMMMDMSMGRQSAGEHELFDKPPPTRKIYVPVDLLWDRYLVQFAMARGFDKRIGIEFVEHEDLRALKHKDVSEGMTWDDLLEEMRRVRSAKNQTHPVLFICERNSLDPKDAKNWRDIAIANEFVGNALIGPPIPGLEPLVIEGFDPDKRRETLTLRLKNIFEFILRNNVEIVCYDSSSADFLDLAAQLAGLTEDERRILASDEKTNTRKSFRLPLSSKDFLFENLWKEYSAHRDDDERPVPFIMGSDFGRAISGQAGFTTYFSRFELQELRKLLQEKRGADDRGNDEARIVTHAMWNLGYPKGAEPDRELERRLAGLAFFLSEYVRTHPDEYVRFIYERHVVLKRDYAGYPISHESIRDAFQQCFNFYHFENYAKLFYYHGSRSRLWVEEDPNFATLHSRRLHQDMIKLRGQCLATFSSYELLRREAISKESVSESQIATADKQADLAWRNYNVFNFGDAFELVSNSVAQLGKPSRAENKSGAKRRSKPGGVASKSTKQ